MTCTEQISDYEHTRADQNTASVAAKTVAAAAGAVHKRGAVAGPGSFTAHGVYNPMEVQPGRVGKTVAPGGSPAGGVSSKPKKAMGTKNG